MKRILLILLALTSSCASHLPGDRGSLITKELEGINAERSRLEISIDREKTLSSGRYKTFTLSLKNNTNDWIDISSIRFTSHGDEEPRFLVGNRLKDYFASVTRRNSIHRYNSNLAIGVLSILGAAGSFSGNDVGNALGNSIIGGVITYKTAESISKSRESVDAVVPENHILRLPVSIPPELSRALWFTIDTGARDYFVDFTVSVETNKKKFHFNIEDETFDKAAKNKKDKDHPGELTCRFQLVL